MMNKNCEQKRKLCQFPQNPKTSPYISMDHIFDPKNMMIFFARSNVRTPPKIMDVVLILISTVYGRTVSPAIDSAGFPLRNYEMY